MGNNDGRFGVRVHNTIIGAGYRGSFCVNHYLLILLIQSLSIYLPLPGYRFTIITLSGGLDTDIAGFQAFRSDLIIRGYCIC